MCPTCINGDAGKDGEGALLWLLTGTQAEGGAAIWDVPGCSSKGKRMLEASHKQ